MMFMHEKGQKMSEEKYYVSYLTHPKDAAAGKRMTKAEAEKYLKELSEDYAEIPQNSCLYSLCAAFRTYDDKAVNLGNGCNRENNFGEMSGGNISVSIHLKDSRKCRPSKCIKNIKNGKCVDDFVCKTIGEKLFPDQYCKQR